MKIFSTMMRLSARFTRTVKAVRQCWKAGGVTQVSIAQINYGGILKGKRVLITGGSAGIGLAIAKKCLSEGAVVVITGRSLEKLEAAEKELDSARLRILQWDIGEIAIMKGKIEATKSLLDGMPDILVNNAGVLLAGRFPDISESVWDVTYATNSKGLFFLTQSICKLWLELKRPGKVINISSTGGFLAANNIYRMTKWDVVGFTQALGLSLAPHGIVVNGIAPGRTATQMLNANSSGNMYDQYQPLERYAHPAELAELALFLMSDAANYIVGQTILCDGGYTLKV